MHCDLLRLPVELQLKIIEELLRDDDIEANANEETLDDDDCSEEQDEPIKIYHDLINWSCTCTYFRNLLAPNIFKTIKLVNNDKSGFSVNAVAESPHNVVVEELHFVGSALGDEHREEPMYSDTVGILPRSVEVLLGNLQRFPRLEKLSIKFDYSLGSPGWEDDIWKSTDRENNPQQVLQDEASVAWRALMCRTYSALTHNRTPQFKHLEIRQLIWKVVSNFSHPFFHHFLSQLEHFTLSIYGEEFGDGMMSNMYDDYTGTMGKLDEYFFNHLAKVTSLSVKAPREGPLGLEGFGAPLEINADRMPLLAILHLQYCCMSHELHEFLSCRADTLKELTLHNCFADECIILWSELFTALFSARPPQIRRFELVVDETLLPNKQNLNKKENKNIRTILQQNPGRRFFPYADMDYSTGNLLYDEAASFLMFMKGDDQKSWDRLMELVDSNAERQGKIVEVHDQS